MTKDKLQLPPLRGLNDFLMDFSKYQLPNFKNLDKWEKRVEQNLLYYQTNYFLMGFFMIMSVTLMHPLKMLSGALSVVVMYGLFYYFVNSNSLASRFKKNHQMQGIVLMLAGASLVVYFLNSLLVFLFGILLPISTMFIHASCRLRNLQNKISNIQRVISKKTPMAAFLESIGTEIEALS